MQIWDLRTGECSQTISTSSAVLDVQFDDARLACATADVDVMLYNVRSGEERRLARHQKGVKALKFFGDMLVSGSLDETVKIWQI